MDIDPRRFRRGLAELHVPSWKTIATGAVAIGLQASLSPASAQALTPNSGGAARDPWRFVPSLSLDETYSDNINLSSRGNELSEFVTTVTPGLRISRASPRVNLAFDYQPQFIYYARGTNGSGIRNFLDATANVTVIENLLFFDASSSITQQNISPFGTQAANTFNGSANRAESRTVSFGPTLRSRYGQDLQYDAGYRYQASNSDNSAYASNHTSVFFADFQSSTSFRDVGFGGNVNRTDQAYGGANEIVTETIGGTLTYVVAPTFHLRGNVGYDRNTYPTTGQADLKGPSYSGGFDWQPDHHSSLNVQVGHRYFGPTANISLQHTTPRYALSAVYTRDQTTSTGSGLSLVADPNYALFDQFFRATIADPVARATAVTGALQQLGLPVSEFGTTGFLSNQLFVQKRYDVSLALFGLRNTVTFDAGRTESQSLSAITSGFDIFNQANRIRSTVYSINANHRLGPHTTINVTAQKIHNVALQGTGDTQSRIFTASVNRQLQPHLSGSVLYRNSSQTGDSIDGGFYGGNYRENAVLGSLHLTF